MATGPKLGTPEQLAEHISANFFSVSPRTVKRTWREQHGLQFFAIHGRAYASFADAERIAAKLIKSAPITVKKGA